MFGLSNTPTLFLHSCMPTTVLLELQLWLLWQAAAANRWCIRALLLLHAGVLSECHYPQNVAC
jgi:hypothetical protein